MKGCPLDARNSYRAGNAPFLVQPGTSLPSMALWRRQLCHRAWFVADLPRGVIQRERAARPHIAPWGFHAYGLAEGDFLATVAACARHLGGLFRVLLIRARLVRGLLVRTLWELVRCAVGPGRTEGRRRAWGRQGETDQGRNDRKSRKRARLSPFSHCYEGNRIGDCWKCDALLPPFPALLPLVPLVFPRFPAPFFPGSLASRLPLLPALAAAGARAGGSIFTGRGPDCRSSAPHSRRPPARNSDLGT